MKKWIRDNRGWIAFFALFGLMRVAVADWNVIPSGSMRPTLLEGDVVFVDRVAYDLKLPFTDRAIARLGEPRRGDVVVFSSPKDGTRLIKRLIALPGDTVEMRDKRLVINGRPAEYDPRDWAMESVGGGMRVPAETHKQLRHRFQRIEQMEGRDAASRPRRQPVLLVPLEAVVKSAGEKGVFVLERDRVRFQAVALGAERGGRAVVEKGLADGDTIVLAPPTSLASGDRVRVNPGS